MKINLIDLRKAVDRVFEHTIETRGIKELNIPQVFYWNVSFKDRFEMAKKPEELGIGSLADEWDFAQNLLAGDGSPIAYQFCQLAPILDYIGNVLAKELAGRGG